MSHVSSSIHIIDYGSTSCNTDRWNFTNIADKCWPSRCGCPTGIVVTVNPSHSFSLTGKVRWMREVYLQSEFSQRRWLIHIEVRNVKLISLLILDVIVLVQVWPSWRLSIPYIIWNGPDVSTGGNSKRTSPLKVGGRNFILWLLRMSKSSVLKTFLIPFEAQIFFKESTTLRHYWWQTWGGGWLSGEVDFWLDLGRGLLSKGEVLGSATSGEFPIESSLRILISSSAYSTFIHVAWVNWTVPIEDRWGVTSSVVAAITESLTLYTWYLIALSNHYLEAPSQIGDWPIVWIRSLDYTS